MSILHDGATAIASSEKEPSSEHLVRMRDCDPFGHLHHSRHIDYYFEAREDHLRTFYDFDLYEFGQRTGRSWFVRGTQIAYFEPAEFNARVRVVTRLINHDSRMLHVEARMYGAADGRLKSMGWTMFRAVDLRTAKPCEHDSDLMALFSRVGAPLEGSPSFEERGKALLQAR